MTKYKVGDEVIVKARISEVYEKNNYPYEAVNVSHRNKARSIALRESDIIQKPDMTAEEAWKLAIKLRYMDYKDKVEIFNLKISPLQEAWLEIMENMSPECVREKIEAWEAENEIKVGDEVEMTYSGNKFFVSQIDSDNQDFPYNGFDKNFGIYHDWSRNQLKKTGRHIDIEGLLKQIGEDE